jgi:hypothetical protein
MKHRGRTPVDEAAQSEEGSGSGSNEKCPTSHGPWVRSIFTPTTVNSGTKAELTWMCFEFLFPVFHPPDSETPRGGYRSPL